MSEKETYGAQAIAEDLENLGEEIATDTEMTLTETKPEDFDHDEWKALREAIKSEIQKKDEDLVGKMVSEGTTPRRLTDLIGSLCDLTSGSGDKGTPIVYIQGYFDNYTNE